MQEKIKEKFHDQKKLKKKDLIFTNLVDRKQTRKNPGRILPPFLLLKTGEKDLIFTDLVDLKFSR